MVFQAAELLLQQKRHNHIRNATLIDRFLYKLI